MDPLPNQTPQRSWPQARAIIRASVPTDYSVLQYIADLRAIRSTGSATAETSFYPPLDRLFNAAGHTLKPTVLFSTQLRNSGAGMPDGGFFPQPKRKSRSAEPPLLQNPERGVVEIKPADYSLEALAAEPQTLRYLRQYELVLITNLRQFRLLLLNPAGAVTLENYTLAATAADLWSAPLTHFARHKDLFPDFLARVMLYRAPLVQPKDVAWLLASYAREARARAEDHPLASFNAVKTALQESLGIRFEGEKGEHFFRSTLVQTLFYGIFSAWVLWHRAPEGRIPNAKFDWRVSAHYLRVPVLRKLFGEMADPGALNSIQLQEVLNLAGEALNRVQPAFFETFREDDAVAYFYEPFLEAFDPQLRKDLGVWYTPKPIVEYMVERVDHLLRTQLHQPLGLASPAVRILDPCCGTGAYLTAVLHRIHRTLLEEAGDDIALVPHSLRTAALTRVFGFEIMPAPFVIAHLQIASLLETAHAPLADQHRAGVFLTNALANRLGSGAPSPVRHLRGVPARARGLRADQAARHHPGHSRQPALQRLCGHRQHRRRARPHHSLQRTDIWPTCPARPRSQRSLYPLLPHAERRILGDAHVSGNQAGCGIVCLITNNAWLDGLSHPSMRYRYLQTFNDIYIDNLNGDKYRTGKTTPEGLPDPSAFSTPQNREGIQLGTAIATLVRNHGTAANTSIQLRDLWGTGKLAQLAGESRHETEPIYAPFAPVSALGCRFADRTFTAHYISWPRLPQLLPASFPGIKTSRDPLVVDIDRDRLEARMKNYFDSDISHEQFAQSLPEAMDDGYMYNAKEIRTTLQERGFRSWEVLRYCYRPFDLRWIYWEPETSLLRRKVEEYAGQMIGATTWLEARQRESGDTFARGTIVSGLADNFGNGLSNFFPAVIIESAGTLLSTVDIHANLTPPAEAYLDRLAVPKLDLFHHVVATVHAPAYRTENAGAPLGDWPRIPLPATTDLLTHSASLGRRLAQLLDAESAVSLVAEWSFLAALKLPLDPNLDDALKLTAGWGHKGQGSTVMPGRGLAPERPWTDAEREKLAALATTQSLTPADALTLLGETCVDVHLNGDACWAAVPIHVWNYTLGGYQVLKKWLSYREFTAEPTSPLLHRPLPPEEAAYFSQVVRRIAAILLLGPALNASYRAILPTATGLPVLPSSIPLLTPSSKTGIAPHQP